MACTVGYYPEWLVNVAKMEEVRSAFNILTERPKGKRPLGRPRHIWDDNVRMDLKTRYQYEELD